MQSNGNNAWKNVPFFRLRRERDVELAPGVALRNAARLLDGRERVAYVLRQSLEVTRTDPAGQLVLGVTGSEDAHDVRVRSSPKDAVFRSDRRQLPVVVLLKMQAG